MALRDNPDFVAGVPRSEALVTLIMGLYGADRFEARKIIVDKITAAGLLEKVEPHVYEVPHGDRCMHEFVASARALKRDKKITAMEIAKRLLDYGYHAPTMSP